MAIKGEDKKKYMEQYNPEYYKGNRKRILKYRKSRRAKDRENWRKWDEKKKRVEQKEKMRKGIIYKKKNPYEEVNPYSS